MGLFFKLIKMLLTIKKVRSIKGFWDTMYPGIKKEARETKELFLWLLKKEGDKSAAFEQAVDLLKMLLVFGIFMIPFIGGIASSLILKWVSWLKPSSFK